MARPLRLELAGGLYHVTSRGDGREDIYLTDTDRMIWLDVFGQTCARFKWVCHAWCQMNNHYHLLIETPQANLARGMRHLNGVYTQRFNREHGRVGHVFQGRYKAILVERDSYLLELARYIVLNPVRARAVPQVQDWAWSSYRATCGQEPKPEWLQTDWILSQFGADHARAVAAYVRFVHEGLRLPTVWDKLQGQIYLGSAEFVQKMQGLVEAQPVREEVPRSQRRPVVRALADYARDYPRDEAMTRAYLSGHYSMAAIARYFGVHYSTASRAVRRLERRLCVNARPDPKPDPKPVTPSRCRMCR